MAGSPIPVAGLEFFLPDKLRKCKSIFNANLPNFQLVEN